VLKHHIKLSPILNSNPTLLSSIHNKNITIYPKLLTATTSLRSPTIRVHLRSFAVQTRQTFLHPVRTPQQYPSPPDKTSLQTLKSVSCFPQNPRPFRSPISSNDQGTIPLCIVSLRLTKQPPPSRAAPLRMPKPHLHFCFARLCMRNQPSQNVFGPLRIDNTPAHFPKATLPVRKALLQNLLVSLYYGYRILIVWNFHLLVLRRVYG
jgi:hypothetical protein